MLVSVAVFADFDKGIVALEQGDYAEAYTQFRAAAEQGLATAQYNLGQMYNLGLGVPQDYAEAVKWYRAAAEQGQADAQNNLGRMYATGEGVPQDYVQAYKWFSLGAAQGDSGSKTNRDIVIDLMTPEQIAEGQKLSREFQPK